MILKLIFANPFSYPPAGLTFVFHCILTRLANWPLYSSTAVVSVLLATECHTGHSIAFHFFILLCVLSFSDFSVSNQGQHRREMGGDGGRAGFDRWKDDNDSYLYVRAFLHFDPWQTTDLSTDWCYHQREMQVTNDCLGGWVWAEG